MKVFIFGANGMLGSYLHKYLSGSIPVTRHQLDAMKIQKKDFYEQIESLEIPRNSVIINAIGIINKRKKPDINFMIVNSIFPRLLAEYCESNFISLIHISTDCVFNGSRGVYTERDLPDDMSVYGISKSAGDCLNCTIIRASIIGENRMNNLDLLEWVRTHENTTLTGWINHIWNGVTCLQLAKICEWIINTNYFWQGVKHIYSPTVISKADLVEMISEIYGLNNKVEKISALVDCDRTLFSLNPIPFKIPDLRTQIIEQKNFEL